MKRYNYRILGISSILLPFIAIGMACYQLIQYSTYLGLAYIIVTPMVFLNTLYQYCRKCPHVVDGTCRHVIFGVLVSKLFKTSESSPYTSKEVLSVLISNMLFFIFPQYWLFKDLLLFILFWTIMLVAIIIIYFGVCPSCCNKYCYFCKKHKR